MQNKSIINKIFNHEQANDVNLPGKNFNFELSQEFVYVFKTTNLVKKDLHLYKNSKQRNKYYNTSRFKNNVQPVHHNTTYFEQNVFHQGKV